MKLPFRKKSAQPPVAPTGTLPYYAPERRERSGMAWLLAIITFLVTLLIILALFFGGRWVYRKIRGNDTNTTTQTQTEQSTTESGANKGTSGQPSSSQPSSGSTAGGSSTNSGTSSTPSSSSTPGGVVSPQAASTNIPNTGPGDTIAIFFAVSLAGYLIHRYILATKE